MSKKTYFLRKLDEFEEAANNRHMKGCMDPRDHEHLEAEYKRTRDKLIKMYNKLRNYAQSTQKPTE